MFARNRQHSGWTGLIFTIGLSACLSPAAKADIVSLAGTSMVQAFVGTVSASPSCAVYCAGALDTIAVAWGTPTVNDLTQALSNFQSDTANPFASIQGSSFSPPGGISPTLWAATASAGDTVTSGSATVFTSTTLTSQGAPTISFNPLSYTGPLNSAPGTRSVYVLMMTFDYTLDGSGLNAGNLALNFGGICSAAQHVSGGTCLGGVMVDVLATGVPDPGPNYQVLMPNRIYSMGAVLAPQNTSICPCLALNTSSPFGPTPPGATGLEVNALVFMEGTSPAVSINLDGSIDLSGSGDLGSGTPEPRTFALAAGALFLLAVFLKSARVDASGTKRVRNNLSSRVARSNVRVFLKRRLAGSRRAAP